MTDDLERRYRLLLHACPKTYRTVRGDELLGTLMDLSHPGQRWPAPRQARALLLAGLRMRTGLSSPAQAWLDSARAALTLMLTAQILVTVWTVGLTRADLPADEPLDTHLLIAAATTILLAGSSIAALLLGRPRLGVTLAYVTPLAGLLPPFDNLYVFQLACWWLPVTALAVPVLRHPTPDRRWRSLLILPTVVLASTLLPLTGHFRPATIAALLALAACLVWAAVIDPRPAIALGLFLLTVIPPLLASASVLTLVVPAALILGAALLGTGAVRAHRHLPA